MKLEQAKLQLDELQKNTSHIEARNRDIKADFEKTAISYQQQIINKSGTRGRFIKMECPFYLNIFQNEEIDKQ